MYVSKFPSIGSRVTANVTIGSREIVKLTAPLCGVSFTSMMVQAAFTRMWTLTTGLSYSLHSLGGSARAHEAARVKSIQPYFIGVPPVPALSWIWCPHG